MIMEKMDSIRIHLKLEKVEELPDAEFPNNTPVGDVRYGWIADISRLPKVGSPFTLVYENRFGGRQTSPVTDIIEPWDGIGMKFKTVNSTYDLRIKKTGELPT